MKNKTFDWQEQAQEELLKIIEKMTMEEEAVFWRNRNEALQEQQREQQKLYQRKAS